MPLYLRESVIFSRGYFVGLKFFLMGISWVPHFFSWIFGGSEIFCRAYFVGPNFFSWVSSWVQIFFFADVSYVPRQCISEE